MTKTKKEDTYTGMFDIPKYSTALAKQVDEKKKITDPRLIIERLFIEQTLIEVTFIKSLYHDFLSKPFIMQIIIEITFSRKL